MLRREIRFYFLMLLLTIFLIFSDDVTSLETEGREIDPRGYILFCPCMGRFGNQVDQYLGSLRFARELNRTLVLPPWVEYKPHKSQSVQVPFNTYFNVTALSAYHRVLLMHDFMKVLAPSVWPNSDRRVLCHSYQPSTKVTTGRIDFCQAKRGNPFQSFWDTYAITFEGSETFAPLSFRIGHSPETFVKEWDERFPPESHPVLAFKGAVGPYPIDAENEHLQMYLQWNGEMLNDMEQYKVQHGLNDVDLMISVHLRMGEDWNRACNYINNDEATKMHNFLSSHQCSQEITREICWPSRDDIIRQIRDTSLNLIHEASRRGANTSTRVGLFVASDSNTSWMKDEATLKDSIHVIHISATDSPHLDLMLLTDSDFFIGNCMSSFTAFVKRQRDVSKKRTNFWNVKSEQKRNNRKDEL